MTVEAIAGDDHALRYAQFSVPHGAKYMTFVTLHLGPGVTEGADSLKVRRRLVETAKWLNQLSRGGGYLKAAVCAVDLGLWREWSRELKQPAPRDFSPGNLAAIRKLLATRPYYNSGGHLYFHVKSDDQEGMEAIRAGVKAPFAEWTVSVEETDGNPLRETRVYGRRILHGLIQSVDPVNMSARGIIGDEDPSHKGGCYCLTQRFIHDWTALGNMTESAIEDMIGRNRAGNLIPNDYERSHLRRARVLDENGLPYRIMSLGQQFGNSPVGPYAEAGVYVSAYAKSLKAFNSVLQSMLGDREGVILDEHLTVSTSDQGNIWYVPSVLELELPVPRERLSVPIHDFFEKRSANGLQYYNTKDFLHKEGRQPAAGNEPLSPRLMVLACNTFSRWHNNWYRRKTYPSLGHLRDHHPDYRTDEQLKSLSVAERKGLTIKLMLGTLLSGPRGREADVFRIDPQEIIVGVLPPFTLGTGVQVMAYLTGDESLDGFMMGLDETSMAGHIVPNYRTLFAKGIGGLLAEARAKAEEKGLSPAGVAFCRSVVLALEGVQEWFRNYAALAREVLSTLTPQQAMERANLEGIARRMDSLAVHPPKYFIDAVQLMFGMHCCLHLVGELVSLGRIDQALLPFYQAGTYPPPAEVSDAAPLRAAKRAGERSVLVDEEAQEIMDAFFLKMTEQALMNRHYFDDYRTFATCAVPYIGGGSVPLGDKASQWVMQVTLGGYLADDSSTPRDGCNPVTLLCLRAARRMPVNAPCLSLRVTPDTPEQYLREAALAILSGGASPYLFNDDLLCRGLAEVSPKLPLRDARDYCADGCWELIPCGKTEFGLTYVPVTNALEAALNRGATYGLAGSNYLRGTNVSFRSKPPEQIGSFEEFIELFYEHYRWLASQAMSGLVGRYGNLWKVCPSPLLSSMVDGCLESGHDLTDGGALYHVLAPQLCGITCTIDSLWAIRKLVYDDATAVTTLGELHDCLMCDWGYDMIEPVQNKESGPERAQLRAQRFKQLREIALGLPKFGTGDAEVDAFGGEVAGCLARIFIDIFEKPSETVSPTFAALLAKVKADRSLPGRPFEFKITPGFGTFEDYLGVGLSVAASADGRRKGSTLSSNFSPMSSPMDLPASERKTLPLSALKGWNGASFRDSDKGPGAINFAGPVDIDIRDTFPADGLVKLMRDFGRQKLGFNLLTITATHPDVLESAIRFPECYDLIRMRMGGWSEFFITMFPEHQEQHKRRPLFVMEPVDKEEDSEDMEAK